ncbi:MAG: hypothetical protein K9N49_00580 [Candidatus Marinimicrobia bacterium]|nr:hypothetical protein [Candidatus Neomarinimicrobiota bacterium]
MKKSQLARLAAFDERIRERAFPNCNSFARLYEVSPRTVARDVEYMRDMLGAPLVFHPERRGYYYSEHWNPPAVAELSLGRAIRLDQIIRVIQRLTPTERRELLSELRSAEVDLEYRQIA